jgi:signal transduction histidine kinase
MTTGGVDQWLRADLTSVPSVVAAAHELKSPLVLVRQLALELQEGLLDPRDAATSYERLRLTAERSLRLVDHLTKAVRLDDMMVMAEPINVTEIFETVAHELTPMAKQLDQRLVVRAQPHLAVVASRDLLRGVVLSLCDNALQHNPKDGTIELLAGKRGSERIGLGIRDQGPQMSPQAFRALRQRLGASPQPIGERPRSSGLGLLIAGTFARHMDSSLQVVRHRQAGLTFRLDLPASRQMSLLDIL